jgi:hypothetical protein
LIDVSASKVRTLTFLDPHLIKHGKYWREIKNQRVISSGSQRKEKKRDEKNKRKRDLRKNKILMLKYLLEFSKL